MVANILEHHTHLIGLIHTTVTLESDMHTLHVMCVALLIHENPDCDSTFLHCPPRPTPLTPNSAIEHRTQEH